MDDLRTSNAPPALPPPSARPRPPRAPLPTRAKPPPVPPTAKRTKAPPPRRVPSPSKATKTSKPVTRESSGAIDFGALADAPAAPRSSIEVDPELLAALPARANDTPVSPMNTPLPPAQSVRPAAQESRSALPWLIAAAAIGIAVFAWLRPTDHGPAATTLAHREVAPSLEQETAQEFAQPADEVEPDEPEPVASEDAEPEEREESASAIGAAPTSSRSTRAATSRRRAEQREPEPEQEATPVAAQPAPAPRPTPAPAPSTDEDLPETPSREQVQEGLLAVRAGVRACMDRDGRVPVQVTIIGRTGRVSVARVDDAYFGQQPMGGCIARAVRQARFPRFSAPRLNVTYPFTF